MFERIRLPFVVFVVDVINTSDVYSSEIGISIHVTKEPGKAKKKESGTSHQSRNG